MSETVTTSRKIFCRWCWSKPVQNKTVVKCRVVGTDSVTVGCSLQLIESMTDAFNEPIPAVEVSIDASLLNFPTFCRKKTKTDCCILLRWFHSSHTPQIGKLFRHEFNLRLVKCLIKNVYKTTTKTVIKTTPSCLSWADSTSLLG